MRNTLLCSIALALAACASDAANDPATGPSVAWRCDGGVSFRARITEGGNAEVTAGARVYRLRGVESGSGVRYASGGVEYWEHGDEAMLNGAQGGPYANCRRG